jgi:DNA/RNA-binding domain of Phe-tRNA-synthetase-like protein
MNDTTRCTLAFDPTLKLQTALVWARGLPGCPKTGAAPTYLADLLGRVRAAGESFLPPERKAAVRGMLRFGKYKPAGRSKPSSEYLLAAALEGDFPLVNGPVDANNAVSLEWGYPASVFDADKTGSELFLRRGLAGESYVFNPSGQTIDLEDLLVVCRRFGDEEPGSSIKWEPCGNPVKDAMATKVFEGARAVVAVVYAPAEDPRARLEACAGRFRELLESECGAKEADWLLIP